MALDDATVAELMAKYWAQDALYPWHAWVPLLLCSCAAWTLVWLVTHHSPLFAAWRPATLTPNERIEWDSRVVSNVHAAVSLYGGYSYFFLLAPPFATVSAYAAAFECVPARDAWLAVTCGYLLYDLVLCLRHRAALASGPGGWLVFVHHVTIVAAFSLGAALHIGTWYQAALVVNEASTPFVNRNFFLAVDPARRASPAYRRNGVLVLLTFLVFRVAHNAVVLAHVFVVAWAQMHPAVAHLGPVRAGFAVVLTLLLLAHVALNAHWFALIVRAAARKLRRADGGADGETEGKTERGKQGGKQGGKQEQAKPAPAAAAAAGPYGDAVLDAIAADASTSTGTGTGKGKAQSVRQRR